MPDLKQLNVRIPCELHAQIEATGRLKQSVVADALKLYFDGCPEHSNSMELALALGQLAVKDTQIAELHIMLQTAINDPPKMLPPPACKHWWQIWRKKR